MITKSEFGKIKLEVEAGVTALFDKLFESCRDWTYVLFLADAEYMEELEHSVLNLNPYTIGSQLDIYKDESRRNFLIDFLNKNYSFNGFSQTDNDQFRVHIELMIYCHIWEATPFLKKLKRIASLLQEDTYHWSVEIPKFTKHDFIRKEVREVIGAHLPAFAEIMRKGFHSQLRNAFAHSDYSFDILNPRITLHNYTGDYKWEMKEISLDDWTKRFAYSALLNYELLNEMHNRRKRLLDDFGKTKFKIVLPSKYGGNRIVEVEYDADRGRFNFA